MDNIISKNEGLNILKLIDSGDITELKKTKLFSEGGACPQEFLEFKYALLFLSM